jgi:predicted TIM-barrel fold metal-dependent hydrolase
MERLLNLRLSYPLLLAALTAVGLASDASAQSAVDDTLIDAHVHLNDPEAWIRLMDEAGIDQAIVFRGRSMDHAGLLAAARRWPGRLVPFLSVSPEHREFRQAWAASDDRLAAIVDSLLDAGGFRGIGEISVSHFPGAGFPEADFDPSGRVMRAILVAARRHRVPITVHVEITRLRELEAVLEDFRDVTVIWAHGGYTPLVVAERLLRSHPNLVYELSARTWAVHPRSPDYSILQDQRVVWPQWLALIEAMPDRFIAGSDSSLRSMQSDREKVASVRRFLDQLSPKTRRMVAAGNLTRILRAGT